MSVFRGSIAEYPGVVVDNFTNCERGRAFFLSHCHKDHMTGLGSPAIFNTLQGRNSSLYCSEVTCSLLLKDPSFTQLAPFLKGLPMEQPVSMTIEPSPDCPPLHFTVTLLPAGHCPGSAMFFFQGEKGNVLYTGDFRLTLDETKRLRPLHCDNRLLDITSLYVDTTFCHPIATKIPSRDVSRDLVVNQIDSWLSQDAGNVVHLQCGMFGYEHIFMSVAKKFNTKIHIARWKINAYSELPSVVDCLTEDGSSTRIHCCNFRKGMKRVGLPCGSFTRYGRPPRVLTIKPSTMWFLSMSKTFKEPFAFMPEYNMYRVLHSMHASYSEVCDFITYLKPRRIVPCVVPVGDASLGNVIRRLKMLLPQSEVQETKQPSELKPQPPLSVRSSMAASCGNLSRKRGRETEERCKIEDCDSDFCDSGSSDDTIDEFVSSEDVSQQRKNPKGFTTDNVALISAKHLGLPSMLAIRYSSAIGRPNTRKTTENGGELKCYVGETSSARSSGSVTVGSLQQMSLELSEEELSLEDKIGSISVANAGHSTHVKKQSNVEKLDKSDKIEADNDRTDLLQQPSLDLSLEDGFSSLLPTGLGKGESSGLMRSNERGSGELPSDGEEWHLRFDGSSENSNSSLGDKKVTDYKVENTKATDGQQSEHTTPKVDNNTIVTPPTKRRKTSKERKKTSKSRKKRSHHHRHHRNHRDHSDHRDCGDHKDDRERHTDLLTPVEGDTMTSATPRKLFHGDNSDNKKESPRQHKRFRSKDLKSIKEENTVIDLTQDDEITQTKADITGSTEVDDDVQKGESPTQGQPRQCPDIKNINHQLTEIRTLIPILEPNLEDTEADSDITFCEDGSEHYSVLGSPCYLPPTPGRENVSSILKRKSIAFSE